MDFSNWQTMLFSAKGRIRRSQWWLWSIIVGVLFSIIFQVVMAVTNSTAVMMQTGQMPLPLMLTYIVLLPVNIWIGACLTAKRWHDRDKSGWMYLIVLIPLVGAIWTLIECGILDGTPGPNKYGPSPKGLGSPETKF